MAPMEMTSFGTTDLKVSRIVLGTWVTGGWAWGGADDKASRAAILRSLELGVNFIDTAPVYGFGKSEKLVGQAIKEWGRRDSVVVATKCGLEWDEKERIRRNSKPERIRTEVEDSLARLGIDRIDLYQIHWPDPQTPFEDSMDAMVRLREEGKIGWIGLSNFQPEQIRACLDTGTVHSLQPPYNVFEREADREILPFCMASQIATLVYGGLCRGLLTGKFTGGEEFPRGDLRRGDPKFKPDRFKQYVKAVGEIGRIASSYGKTPAQFALRWALQQPGVTCVIAGARAPVQAEDNTGISGWAISEDDLRKVDHILTKHIKTPVGPEFMAPRLES
ncbi:MAG: aldo/keto reductase [Syntrophobacteraceae bacterium]|nr:aldo/keto reductase [Syntrophobacteraceae bacterium]